MSQQMMLEKRDDYLDLHAKYYDWECAQFLQDQHFDIEYYVRKAAGVLGPILEIGCGTGRVTLALAEQGHTVIGIDPSSAMLEQAEQKVSAAPASVRDRIRLVLAGAQELDLGEQFELIVIPYNALLYMGNQRQQLACLRAIVKHLKPGGRVVLEATRVDTLFPSVDEWKLLTTARWRDNKTVIATYHKSSIDHASQIMQFDLRHVQFLTDGRESIDEYAVKMRYVPIGELRLMLESEGLAMLSLEGSYDGAPYEAPNDYRMLITAGLAA